MTTYYYMRNVYRNAQGSLHTYGDERGTVTLDPVEAYKRHRRAYERRYFVKYGQCLADRRGGEMFAYWQLGEKMPWRKALDVARTAPPERVCVLTGDHQWWMVEFVLPPGELVRVEQYEWRCST